MVAPVDFSDYLRSLVEAYRPQPDFYTLTDLQVEIRVEKSRPDKPPTEQAQTEPEDGKPEKEIKVERSPVLTGLRKYGQQGHVLLVGKPGSGKSTTLQRLLWEEVATDAQTDEADRERVSASSASKFAAKSAAIPVLVELRSYTASIEDLIQRFFRRHRLRLNRDAIDDLLFEGQLFLLLDGVNELPSAVLGAVEAFRKDNARCSMIFTTRALDAGTGLGIAQKLEMCALTEPQMREFIQKRLPGQAETLLRQLQDRLRELAETPLLLKILCDVFAANGQIPQSRGELFRKHFAQQYAEFKRLPELVGDRSGLLPQLLQTLAFEMMQGNDPSQPTQFVLQLPKAAAADKIQQFLQTDRVNANDHLQALVKHHLLQQSTDPRQIEFCHQLFQEYYAAEYLLFQLEDTNLSDAQLKRDYLNLLKWTEPLAMVAALVDQAQALRLVRLALEVDWMLGARLAGAVLPAWQKQTMEWVSALEIPAWLKVKLWGQTQSEAALPSLLKALDDQNDYVRRRAAEALGKLGSDAAIPGLLKALDDQDYYVRKRAVYALGKLGSDAAIPGLLKALDDQHSSVRESAAEALGKLGSDAAIPGLLRALDDQDFSVRESAAEALGKLGSDAALSGLLRALNDQASDVRWRAAEALGKLGSDTAIPGLLRALDDRDSSMRWRAAETLGKLGSEAALSGLLKALADQHSSVRWRAAEALGKLGSDAALSGLLKALDDQNDYVRRRAAEALGKLGSDAALSGLLKALADQDSSVRGSAAEALGKLGSDAALSGLLKALADQHSSVRESAAEAVGKLGSDAAIPGLLRALDDQNDYVRRRAVDALGKLGAEATVPGLLRALADQDSDVRRRAVDALGKLGSEAIVPGLLRALDDRDSSMRRSAAEALGKLGSDAAVPGLLKALADQHSSVRESAAEALGKLGSEAALSGLLRALADQDYSVRGSAAEALGKLGSDAALPGLLRALDDQNDYVRRRVVDALENLGSEAALPGLLKALDDPDSDVRGSAAEALGKLESEAALPGLLRALDDQNDYVRRRAVDALGRIGGEIAASSLIHLLTFRGAAMRESAADALGHLQQWQQLSALIQALAMMALAKALNDRHLLVRSAAAEALTKIANPKLLPNLQQRLASAKYDEVARVIAAIQANCQFYNYEIFEASSQESGAGSQEGTTNVFNIGTLDASGSAINLGGTIHGDQIGSQSSETEP